jgi:hypothetical protein
MEVEQMMARLLTEIRTNREEMKEKMKTDREIMKDDIRTN